MVKFARVLVTYVKHLHQVQPNILVPLLTGGSDEQQQQPPMVPPHLVQPGSSSAQQPSTIQSKALNYSNNVTQQASALGLPPANFTQ